MSLSDGLSLKYISSKVPSKKWLWKQISPSWEKVTSWMLPWSLTRRQTDTQCPGSTGLQKVTTLRYSSIGDATFHCRSKKNAYFWNTQNFIWFVSKIHSKPLRNRVIYLRHIVKTLVPTSSSVASKLLKVDLNITWVDGWKETTATDSVILLAITLQLKDMKIIQRKLVSTLILWRIWNVIRWVLQHSNGILWQQQKRTWFWSLYNFFSRYSALLTWRDE